MTAYLKVRPVAVAGVAKLLTAFLTPANNNNNKKVNNTCGRVLSLRVSGPEPSGAGVGIWLQPKTSLWSGSGFKILKF